MKKLFTLLTMLLAFAATGLATTYSIAGSNTTLFGGSSSWDVSNSSTEMSLDAAGNYVWTSSATLSSTSTVNFKVVQDHAWTHAWPSSDYSISVPAGQKLTVVFNESSKNVVAFTSLTVAGEPADVFGSSDKWNVNNTNAQMALNTTTGLYEWESNVFTLSSAQTISFKVTGNGAWYPDNNVTKSASANQAYKLKVTFNPGTKSVTSDLQEVHTYTVAGNSTNLFGTSFDPTNTANDMTDDGNGVFTKTFGPATSNESVELKVVQDHAWTNAWPEDNYEIGVPAGHTLTVTFNSGNNTVSATTTGTPVYHVAGSDATMFGAAWTAFQSAGAMTQDGSVYTWTYGPVATATNGVQFKVVKNGTWATSYPSTNISVDIPANHAITVTYNPSDNSVNYTLTDHTPATYTVAGSSTVLFGSPAWDATNTANDMTLSGGVYTKTFGPATASEAVTFKVVKNHDFNVAAYPSSNYAITVPKGHSLTVTYNPTGDVVSATTSGPDLYTVAGNNTELFGGEWLEINDATAMTLSDGLYTWTSVEATGNYNVELKVVKNCDLTNSAYPTTGNYTITVPKGYALKVTYNTTGDVVDASLVDMHPVNPTGEMYIIGEVSGNPWLANVGLKMLPNSDNTIFKLTNVQIVAGAAFSFATRLATTETDWTTLQQYRLTSTATGDFWLVNTEMTDTENPQQLSLDQWRGDDKPFKMGETANYDITVDLNTMKVTIKRRYGTLYMFYGDHWDPSNGVSMITHDGYNYILSDVLLSDGDSFQFATELSQTVGDWTSIANKRLGANADGDEWTVQKDMIGSAMNNALRTENPKDFKMGSGTTATYRIVVNPSQNTVTLFKMADVLDGKVIIHLEKTTNVTNPKIWAYDKERTPSEQEIHVNRPSRTVIANERLEVYLGEPNAADVKTADGREWWTWELSKPMSDFWFTRGSYNYNKSDASNADMTDINWRKSGEIYLTWPQTGTELEDYTRDYYAAAAKEAAVVAVMIEGHLYVYFTNTPGWENVFCHAWYTDDHDINHDLLTPPAPYTGSPTYPGAQCEFVGYDNDGYSVWRMDLTKAGVTQMPTGILFNNGVSNHMDYATGETTSKPSEQSSDNEYKNGTCYDYCGVVVLGSSLGGIISGGVVNGPVYTIEDELIGVYFDERAETVVVADGSNHTVYGALYCKDKNNFVTTSYVERSVQKEGQIDYMKTNYVGSLPDRYDQSNWVKFTLSMNYPGYVEGDRESQLALLRDYVGCVIPAGSVKAQLADLVNPTMHLALDALPDAGTLQENTYYENPNVYVISSLGGSQTGTDKYGRTYDFFFVTPKPNEFATITWAVYGGNGKFYAPTSGWYDFDGGQRYNINGYDLNGYFPVEWDAQSKPADMEDYVGQLFSFKGIVHYNEASTGGGSGVRRKYGEVSGTPPYTFKTNVNTSSYTISPIDLNPQGNSIITSVEAVEVAPADVESVTYVDVMGRQSSRPFEGVNIVVTRYADGSVQTTKELR